MADLLTPDARRATRAGAPFRAAPDGDVHRSGARVTSLVDPSLSRVSVQRGAGTTETTGLIR